MDRILEIIGTWLIALLQPLLFVCAAPLLAAWIKRVKCRLQGRRGPSLVQPYRDLRKLFAKDIVVARTASPLFRMAPYVIFGATVIAAAAIPLVTTQLPSASLEDAIAMVGVLALARVFLALAGMDIGTAFGGLGASREMLVSVYAEPALLLAVFTLAMTAHSTNLASVTNFILHSSAELRPSFLFALAALLMVSVAETGRIPVDNPSTHLELTMIHEGMVLEYSGRHLALIEWASELNLMLYGVLIVNLFFPWGLASTLSPVALGIGFFATALKLAALGVVLAVVETVSAKMRIFRVPTFLNFAFLLGLLGVITHVILYL